MKLTLLILALFELLLFKGGDLLLELRDAILVLVDQICMLLQGVSQSLVLVLHVVILFLQLLVLLLQFLILILHLLILLIQFLVLRLECGVVNVSLMTQLLVGLLSFFQKLECCLQFLPQLVVFNLQTIGVLEKLAVPLTELLVLTTHFVVFLTVVLRLLLKLAVWFLRRNLT